MEKKEILKIKKDRDNKLFTIANDLIIYLLYMFLVISIATFTIGEGVFRQAENIKTILNVITFVCERRNLQRSLKEQIYFANLPTKLDALFCLNSTKKTSQLQLHVCFFLFY